jgi:uncharacterized protein (TIGR03083 family)
MSRTRSISLDRSAVHRAKPPVAALSHATPIQPVEEAMDEWAAIDAERAALADVLTRISIEQWDAQSLCDAWKIRDVVAHLIDATQFTVAGLFRVVARHGIGFNTMRASLALERGVQPPKQLLADLRGTVGLRVKPTWARPIDMLFDTTVHAQDIRRPLGLAHSFPADTSISVAERLKQVGFLFGTKKRIAGLRLVASDVAWSNGDGAEVSGPIEALIMMMAGRRSAVADLSGDGVATLTERTSSPGTES